jgi:hypothetical protein
MPDPVTIFWIRAVGYSLSAFLIVWSLIRIIDKFTARAAP